MQDWLTSSCRCHSKSRQQTGTASPPPPWLSSSSFSSAWQKPQRRKPFLSIVIVDAIAAGSRVLGVTPYMSSLFQSCNKGGRMTCHVSRALDILFLLQIVNQPIVEGKRGFGCARESAKLVAWHCTPAFVIEKMGVGQMRLSTFWIGRPVSPARNVHFERP